METQSASYKMNHLKNNIKFIYEALHGSYKRSKTSQKISENPSERDGIIVGIMP